MKLSERVERVDGLAYEDRLAFVAFCVERCLTEARRHEIPRRQLDELPLLGEGVDMLWARAADARLPDGASVERIVQHLKTYEGPAPDGEHAIFYYDVSLVHTARMLTKGMRLLLDPEVTSRYVAGATEGAVMSVGLVYRDFDQARANELAVEEAALQRLVERGPEPPARGMFDDIPDWPRGEVRAVYAEGRIRGTAPEWEE